MSQLLGCGGGSENKKQGTVVFYSRKRLVRAAVHSGALQLGEETLSLLKLHDEVYIHSLQATEHSAKRKDARPFHPL